ncbi:prepilin-type N-terminal cleavage/methylation domain-containing protein [Cryobacterium gelidum]|uniref:Uncharacterized protein n=1 Tax=Cryobacterium gelidum TaxID=1259164 RepID=A0A4R9ANL9_9MICO|nr:prepilin-type N-terminal cleavage/methylation domain-containing protein [Cryobacterium gelidum]TFD66589.1 hypothetical protein E3T50_15400 [Cryobacterium gelidum]
MKKLISTLAERRSTEAGFTLVELLIYSVLSVVVLLIVGGILINSLRVERSVREASQASSAGQLVASSVSLGVRNASGIWQSAPGVVPQILMVRTVGSAETPNWRCQAWSYDNGEVRTKYSTGAISMIQTSTSVKSWMILAEGAQPLIVAAVPAPVFTVAGRRVDLALDMSTGAGRPVLISTSSVSRQPTTSIGGLPTCFP